MDTIKEFHSNGFWPKDNNASFISSFKP